MFSYFFTLNSEHTACLYRDSERWPGLRVNCLSVCLSVILSTYILTAIKTGRRVVAEMRSLRAELLQTDGRTDGQNEADIFRKIFLSVWQVFSRQ
jgi:hypothetical protein